MPRAEGALCSDLHNVVGHVLAATQRQCEPLKVGQEGHDIF